ncbi:sigma-70 family RNA polymerase sigma factor [Nonomuraea sp. NPDC050227]|uniref:sigma-70 family RNA polymerase sigma factor n=1 Tax=Nonomuraea sp. NPDC050227 TaxID=3364360 RepID=UPI0037B81820
MDPGFEAVLRQFVIDRSGALFRTAYLLTGDRHAAEDLRPGDGHADAADLRLTMRAALSRLTPRQRTMLVLRYFEDKSETEIADLLGVRVGSVRSQIYRSLERLKKTAPELSAVREFR